MTENDNAWGFDRKPEPCPECAICKHRPRDCTTAALPVMNVQACLCVYFWPKGWETPEGNADGKREIR